jgi:hypothetical protein
LSDFVASRRNILKLLGVTPAAAPLAAKAAADSEIAKLAGLALDSAPPRQYAPSYGMGEDYLKARVAAADYVKLLGVPDFVKEQLRRNAQYVSCLDPDLAAKRSWSMAVKIVTQRERNFERQLELLSHSSWHAKSMVAFKKITGWEWPWQ